MCCKRRAACLLATVNPKLQYTGTGNYCHFLKNQELEVAASSSSSVNAASVCSLTAPAEATESTPAFTVWHLATNILQASWNKTAAGRAPVDSIETASYELDEQMHNNPLTYKMIIFAKKTNSILPSLLADTFSAHGAVTWTSGRCC